MIDVIIIVNLIVLVIVLIVDKNKLIKKEEETERTFDAQIRFNDGVLRQIELFREDLNKIGGGLNKIEYEKEEEFKENIIGYFQKMADKHNEKQNTRKTKRGTR